MQIQKVQPVMINQTSFGKKDALTELKKYEGAISAFDNDDLASDAKAAGLIDLIEFKAIEDGKKPSPLQFLLAATGIGATAVLTAKLSSGRILSVVQKKFPEAFEGLGKGIVKVGKELKDRLAVREVAEEIGGKVRKADSGFARDLKNAGTALIDGIRKYAYGKNPAADMTSAQAGSNLFAKTASNTVALLVGGKAVKTAASDKKGGENGGSDGIADLLQNPTKQKAVATRLALEAANLIGEAAA